MEFTYQNRTIHYEEHGSGQPLLLLNGVMMSTASWAPFVQAFSRSFRLLLLDLMDQGQSDAFPDGYTMKDQARMVSAFLDHLGLNKVLVLGTSYGGALALQLSVDDPGRVKRLLLAATRAYTDPLFRDMCEGWIHATSSPQAFYTATMFLFYGATWQAEQAGWMAERRQLLESTAFSRPDFLARMKRLISSIMAFDLRDRLAEISCPTLVLAPTEDLVMMPWEQERIAKGIPGAELLALPRTGHVLFLERPALFVALTMGWFLNQGL